MAKRRKPPVLPKTLGDLTEWSKNPRVIDDSAAAGLKFSVDEYGDISGIVFNRRNGQLIGAHQRRKQLAELFGDDTPITDVEGPDDAGDYYGRLIDGNGRRWSVRIVDWDEDKHAAANVAANSQMISGEFTDDLSHVLEGIQAANAETFENLRLDDLATQEQITLSTTVPQESEVGITIDESYIVMVTCKDETDQEKLFEEMRKEGRTCRLLTL